MITRALWMLLLCMLSSGLPAQTQKVSMQALTAAKQSGSVRVLVMLNDAQSRRSGYGSGPTQQVAAVDQSIAAVLGSLPKQKRTLLRRFSTVPAFVMQADEATLRRLRNHPLVRRVDLDSGGSGSAIVADEASVLNKVSGLQALGLGGRGMKVAVIDTGIDSDHADLRSRLIGQQCFCSSSSGSGGCCPNGLATQSGAGAAEDDNGHGTNVNGIIVGEGNVAPRGAVPEAQLVVVKVMDRNNSFCCSSDVVAAMDWLAVNHPDVDAVNLSLGTSTRFDADCDNSTAYTQAMAKAVDKLMSLGAVVMVSTGNSGDSARMEAPACVHNALSTAATWDYSGGPTTFLGCTESATSPMQPTCFSNRSITTDLYAAGAMVTSAGNGGGTSTYGGTSMAAPMVAACAVALKQAAPLSTVQQRIDAITLSPTRVVDQTSGRRYPFLDCKDALRLINPSIFKPIPMRGSQPWVPPKPSASSPRISTSSAIEAPDKARTRSGNYRPGISTSLRQAIQQ